MINPKFSLIIPVFNEEKVIIDKLANCLELDYSKCNYEIFVVDDYSTDKTCKIVKKYIKHHPNIRLIKNRFSKGKVGCVKTALNAVKYEYVSITDADVILKKDILRNSIKYISKKNVGAICGIQNLIGNRKNKAFSFENIYRKFYTKLRLLESRLDSAPVFHGQFMIVKKSILRKIKIFYDDTDIAIKIRKLGYKTLYIRECIFYERALYSIKNLRKQKSRRSVGLILIFLDNANVLFNPKYGLYGILIYPFEFSLYILQPVFLFSILAAIFFKLIFISWLYSFIYAFLLLFSYIAIPFFRSYIFGNISLIVSLYTILSNFKKSKDLYLNCNWSSDVRYIEKSVD